MNGPMNICLVSQEYPPDTAHGGIGTQTWNKARWLARLGHSPHVVSCAGAPSSAVTIETQNGITVHRLPPYGEEAGDEFPVGEPAVYWMGYSWTVARYLHRLARRVRFDVLDFPDYGAEGFAYLLTRESPAAGPVAIQLHGCLAMCGAYHHWPRPQSEFYRVGTLMEEISLQRADALMACSTHIADFTARRHGLARDAITIAYCGVDCETFTPPAVVRRGRPTVLFVGDISEKKGAHIVFDAVMRLRAKHPDVRLRFAGRLEDRVGTLLADRMRAEHLHDTAECLGFVHHDRLPDLYRDADVFVSPADHELGVANVYIEAMASGCPVVAVANGGAAEAVVHGETGLLVPPDDMRATSEAIDRLLSDAAFRHQMGRAARARAESRFGMDLYIETVLDVYRRAIDAAHAAAPEAGDQCPSELLF